jgi:hypothetical protein
MEPMTIKQLLEACQEVVSKGYGDKQILISDDDEGNGYHTLYFGFTIDDPSINLCSAFGMFQDDNNPDDVVLLG